MGKKYRRYKNFLEKFLDSSKGKRLFNIVYSVGAAIVILGAMFKILHLPFGNQMLMFGMITEAIVFLLSAFEKPDKEYKWEEVYPVLADDSEVIALDKDPASMTHAQNIPTIQHTTYPASKQSYNSATSTSYYSNESSSQKSESTLNDKTQNIADASHEYINLLSHMSENITKFSEVTDSLSTISETLLKSFETIINNSEGLGNNTQNYVKQMDSLNRNISGLNTIYEVQLKSASSQIGTIEEINAGLDRMKKLFSGSLADSSIFKNETEKMAQQLAELNKVYARLLQAMTTNMNMSGGFSPTNNSNTQP